MQTRSVSNIKVALVWTVLGAFATAAVLAYAFALFPIASAKVPVPLAVVAAAQLVQATILIFLLCWLGLICGAGIGLDSPVVRSWLGSRTLIIMRRRVALAAFLGCAATLIIFAASWVFDRYMPPPRSALPAITLWKRILAAPYGGIVEECLCRLFLMSVIAWVLAKVLFRQRAILPRWLFWLAIGVSAVLFGVGHLPAAVSLWPVTSVVVLRTVALNSIGGFVFGWIFWRWGLEYAVISHFCADVVIHGFGSA